MIDNNQNARLTALVAQWRNLITSPRYGAGVVQQVRLEMCANELEAILADEPTLGDRLTKLLFQPPAAASGEHEHVHEFGECAICGEDYEFEIPAPPSPSDQDEWCECKHGCLNFAISGENYCHDCGYAVWWEHDTSHGQPESEVAG